MYNYDWNNRALKPFIMFTQETTNEDEPDLNRAQRVDNISKLVFPLAFLVFLIIFFSV